MITIDLLGGENIWNVLHEAVRLAADGEAVGFTFNGLEHDVQPGESFEHAKARVELQTGFPLLSPDEVAEKASADLAKMKAESAAAIAAAGVLTERQMREADVPWPKTTEELTAYIKALIYRPHDYGTCVYAMSMAATAAFYHVASVLGATGYQASCADMDILRRTRRYEHGFRVVDYGDALYPQYWDAERSQLYRALFRDEAALEQFKKSAQAELDNPANAHAHPHVREHWQRIADGAIDLIGERS